MINKIKRKGNPIEDKESEEQKSNGSEWRVEKKGVYKSDRKEW